MKTTIELAREVGLHLYVNDITEAPYAARLKAFEALVRADERDLCAQVVWEMKGQCWAYDHDTIATAIRARGTHD
jgi:hypothetical protein